MRRVCAAALAVVLASACLVYAQEPVVTGDTKVEPGKLLRLSVPLAPGESALWDVYPPGAIDHDVTTTPAGKDKEGKTVAGSSRLRGTALPGDAYVKVTVYRVIPGDTPTIVTEAKGLTVTFVGERKAVPDDEKKAGPVPPPAPAPEAVALVVAVVEEGAARTAAQAKVLGDTNYWQNLKTRGHKYFHYKMTSSELAGLGYLDEMKAQGVTPPALLVMAPLPGTDTATVRACEGLPKSTGEIDAVLKRYSTK